MSSNGNLYNVPVSSTETFADIVSGQNGLVLVFMPDATGISSQLQLKNLRNDHHKILSLGWKIVVISSADPEKLSESTDELSLPFHVMHDINNTIGDLFNTLGTDFTNPYITRRTKRRTYILDTELNTLHVIDDIHPSNHSNEILSLLHLDELDASSFKNSHGSVTEN